MTKTRFPKYGGQKGVMHKVKSKFNFGKKIPTGEHYIDRVTWRGLTKEQRESIQKYREKIGFKGGSKSVISEITTLSNPISLSNKDIHRIAEAIGGAVQVLLAAQVLARLLVENPRPSSRKPMVRPS